MTKQRVRELKDISAQLYATVLDNIFTHTCGEISDWDEEIIVLAELAQKITRDINQWRIEGILN